MTDSQVSDIEKRIRSSKTTKTRKDRLRILLLLDTAHNKGKVQLGYNAIAERLGVCRNMVVGL